MAPSGVVQNDAAEPLSFTLGEAWEQGVAVCARDKEWGQKRKTVSNFKMINFSPLIYESFWEWSISIISYVDHGQSYYTQ